MTTDEGTGYRGPDRRRERRGVVPLPTALIGRTLGGLTLVVVAAVGWLLFGDGGEAVSSSTSSLTAPVITAVGALLTLLVFVRALMSGDARMLRASLALLVYTGGALPISLAAAEMSGPRAFEAASFAIAGLLAVSALRTPDVDTTRPIALTVCLAFAGMIGLGAITLAAGASSELALRAVYLAVLVAGTAALMRYAVQQRRGALWNLGTCLLLFGAAQFLDIAATPVTAAMCAAGVALHLAGVALLVHTAVSYVRCGLAARRRGEATIRDRCRIAEVAIREEHAAAAERDHEIRNIVAGLAGATYSIAQLRDRLTASDLQRLDRAVQTEIAVLQLLVSPQEGSHPHLYDVGTTLADVVDVQRAAGQRITFTAGSGLLTRGRPAALIQIVTNLLRNAATHAPGSSVHVAAAQEGESVIVTVTDDGPGLGSANAEALLERGVRGHDAGPDGLGLGLHVSSQLAANDGGSLRLVTSDSAGCTAILELPGAAAVAAVSLSAVGSP